MRRMYAFGIGVAVQESLCKSLCSSCYMRVSCRVCTLLYEDSATVFAASSPAIVGVW